MDTCNKCNGSRLRAYGDRIKCLDCAKKRAKARRDGADTAGGRPSKAQSRAKQIQVAALAGAGQPIRAIAKATGYRRETVAEIIQKRLPDDPGLQRIFNDAQAEIAPLAVETVKDALKAAHAAVRNGYDVVAGRDKEGKAIVQRIPCPPDKAATVAREAHNISWDYTIGRGEPQTSASAPSFHLDTTDPAVMASFVEALRMLNEPMRTLERAEESS